MDKLLTIIVPVYNAGDNIDHCVNSLINQTDKRFVALLINDGSSDDSLERIKKVEEAYPDLFKVLSHDNQGVVKTRKRGILEANTKYIAFMDNDDFIDQDYVEVHLREIEKDDSDIIISGYRRANFDKVLFTIPAYNDIWTRYRINAPWARIFRRDFIVDNDVSFLETYIGEDTYFNMSAYQHTNKIRGIDYIGYNWFYNNDSVSNMKQRGLKPECDVLVVLKAVDQLYQSNSDKLLNYFYIRYVTWYLLFSGVDAKSDRFYEEYLRLFDWIETKGFKLNVHFYSKCIKSEPLKNRLIVSIFNGLRRLHLVKVFAKFYCKG